MILIEDFGPTGMNHVCFVHIKSDILPLFFKYSINPCDMLPRKSELICWMQYFTICLTFNHSEVKSEFCSNFRMITANVEVFKY